MQQQAPSNGQFSRPPPVFRAQQPPAQNAYQIQSPSLPTTAASAAAAPFASASATAYEPLSPPLSNASAGSVRVHRHTCGAIGTVTVSQGCAFQQKSAGAPQSEDQGGAASEKVKGE